MKALYFDCHMGMAGDMMMGALYDLLTETQKNTFLAMMSGLGINGLEIRPVSAVRRGVRGIRMKVEFFGREEQAADFEDGMPSRYRTVNMRPRDIEHVLSRLELEPRIREEASAVFVGIADAESKAHNMPVTEIHFHELGTLDAVADVVGNCLLMDMLKPEKVTASPVNVGQGYVMTAHGKLAVPAPATSYLLEGIPFYSGEIESELCTPTGAALLRHFCSSFGPEPHFLEKHCGCGCGQKDLEAANVVFAWLGTTK